MIAILEVNFDALGWNHAQLHRILGWLRYWHYDRRLFLQFNRPKQVALRVLRLRTFNRIEQFFSSFGKSRDKFFGQAHFFVIRFKKTRLQYSRLDNKLYLGLFIFILLGSSHHLDNGWNFFLG
jgi:hypothetical protein